jgi:hypothetical protein
MPFGAARALVLFAVTFGSLLVGCGSKSALFTPSPGPDAGPIDAFEPPPPTLEVDCGRPFRRVAVGRPFVLRATVTATAPLVSEVWSVAEVPVGVGIFGLPRGAEIGVTVPAAGAYRFRFEARDEAGNTGTCAVDVQARDTDVVAICPPEDEYEVGPGMPLLLEGDAFDPGGRLDVEWVQTGGPAPAMLRVLGGAGAVVEFTSEVAGTYTLVLRAVGEVGSDECGVLVRVSAPPVVECGGAVAARTRQPVTVTATAIDTDLARLAWEMVSRPEGSSATNAPADQLSTTFTPDRRGEYVLRFTAFDAGGASASCEVTVIAEPTGPDAICPGTIETRPLTTITLEGSAVDDGTIVSYGWTLRSEPPGSASMPPAPPNAARAMFVPQLAGEYLLELAVRDDDGNVATCTTLVRAIATEGLRVEVFWNTDGTDMDTHLMRPDGTAWFTDDDCYYGNCQGGRLTWPPGGSEDDPSLDIDDVDGFGPENINIESPADGTYRVAIDAFRGAANTTVRIYCGGSTTEPRQTFGPVFIDSAPNDLWRVADVTISGTSCIITDLRGADGRPDIRPCDGNCPR